MRKDVAEHYNKTMFSGFDTDPSMLRIGAMNMLMFFMECPKYYHSQLTGVLS